MANTLKRKPKSKDSVIHQFMFLEAPVEIVSAEAVTWGESAWWPKDCLWKYLRQTDGDIRVGTQYVIKINKPSSHDWAAEVTQLLPTRLIERTFTRGMFKGFERVLLEEKSNGTRLDYELHFQIRGPINFLLWPFYLRGQYIKTIKSILSAFKDHTMAEVRRQQSKLDGSR
ncbi:MAG: hypothetical protein IT395_00830 [Candidatus Omnitrophica bacterium]|nr:hypothetical protein [Candidatus Omnitrophota bacterium]